MTAATVRPAPYPSDLRAKGWRFALDYERIVQSDTWALASPSMRPWLLMTWMVAWQQTPCGSLSNSDELNAARIGMEVDQFVSNRKILLRGWWLADDGRLYHGVIAEQVIGMIEHKRSESDRKAEYRQRKAAEEAKAKAAQEAQKQADLSQVVPRDNHGTTTGVPHPSGSCDDTGTGTGTLINIYVPQATPDRTPNCPYKEIIALYRKHLPNLPQPKMSLWEKSENARALKARWLWVITEFKEDGSRIAETIPQGLEWFDRFFAYVARSDFLTGRSGSWCADLGWLVKLKNFEKAVQGNYENKNAEAAT